MHCWSTTAAAHDLTLAEPKREQPSLFYSMTYGSTHVEGRGGAGGGGTEEQSCQAALTKLWPSPGSAGADTAVTAVLRRPGVTGFPVPSPSTLCMGVTPGKISA